MQERTTRVWLIILDAFSKCDFSHIHLFEPAPNFNTIPEFQNTCNINIGEGSPHVSLKNRWSTTFPGHEGEIVAPWGFLTLGPRGLYKYSPIEGEGDTYQLTCLYINN